MQPRFSDAVTGLVEQVRSEAHHDIEARRAAFCQALTSLQIDNSELRAWRDGLDIVGSVYTQLFSGAERRQSGQFFTPFWAGEVMAGWVFEEGQKLVLDPGCGSGGLLIPAARHPKRGGTALLGIDVDPLAVHMLETNVRLREMTGVNARSCNFLLDGLEEAPDAILCNPPYSRHHAISPEAKAAIHSGFEERLGISFSRLAALHVLFLVRAIEVAAEGARIAFITPSDWLDVGYGKRVKQFLLERAHIEAIILIEESHLFFEGALTTAAITLIHKMKPIGKPTKLLRLEPELPKPEDVLRAITGKHSEHAIEEVSLSASAKWSRPSPNERSGRTLASVARVQRGIATGKNGFFVISERTRKEWGIKRRRLKRCVSSPRLVTAEVVTEELLDGLPDDVPRWLVDSKDEEAIEQDSAFGRYLRSGLGTNRVDQGYLASRRRPWYSQEQRGDCPILFTYFNRERPRFVRNRARAVPLNNWLIIDPKEGTEPELLFKALQSKSVREQLDERRRVYGGGLWKLEPSELLDIRLDDELGNGE